MEAKLFIEREGKQVRYTAARSLVILGRQSVPREEVQNHWRFLNRHRT